MVVLLSKAGNSISQEAGVVGTGQVPCPLCEEHLQGSGQSRRPRVLISVCASSFRPFGMFVVAVTTLL
jgi:hypothetical protein